jgi:hypothetical protein
LPRLQYLALRAEVWSTGWWAGTLNTIYASSTNNMLKTLATNVAPDPKLNLLQSCVSSRSSLASVVTHVLVDPHCHAKAEELSLSPATWWFKWFFYTLFILLYARHVI